MAKPVFIRAATREGRLSKAGVTYVDTQRASWFGYDETAANEALDKQGWFGWEQTQSGSIGFSVTTKRVLYPVNTRIPAAAAAFLRGK